MTDYRIEENETDLIADRLRCALPPITQDEIDATIKRISAGIERMYNNPGAVVAVRDNASNAASDSVIRQE